MCWRQVSKLQKIVLLVLFYLTVYLLISYAMTPDTQMAFVAEDVRVGDRFAYIFIVAPSLPVFSDAEGADVFRTCGRCFITNNKGFLPLREYDAILVHGNQFSETSMDPDKRYLIETSSACISSKFTNCLQEPRVTSFSNKESFTLCSLCESLLNKRL